MDQQSNIYKVVLVGPQGSGKTSIVERYEKKNTDFKYPQQTSGVNFAVFEFLMTHKLDIFDFAGNSKFEKMLLPYYAGAKAVLIVIPINMEYKEAKAYIIKQINIIRNKAPKDAKRVLIFSKFDLLDDKSLTDSQLNELWSLLRTDIPYFTCSAKNNDRVKEIFFAVANMLWPDIILWPNINKLDEAFCKQILDDLRIKIEKRPSWELSFFGGNRIDLINDTGTKTTIKAPDGIVRICEVLNYFASHKHPTITYKEALEQIIFIFQSKLNNTKQSRNSDTSLFYRDAAKNICNQINTNLTTIKQTESYHH